MVYKITINTPVNWEINFFTSDKPGKKYINNPVIISMKTVINVILTAIISCVIPIPFVDVNNEGVYNANIVVKTKPNIL